MAEITAANVAKLRMMTNAGMMDCKRALTDAQGDMEKAVEITPRSGRVWIALFQAYRLKGDEAKARNAADQLNKFFKADKATVEEQASTKEQKTPVEKPAQQKSTLDVQMPTELK